MTEERAAAAPRLRTTLFSNHVLTSKAPTGIGKTFAGNADKTQLGKLQCLGPHEHTTHTKSQRARYDESAVEIFRCACLRKLKKNFEDICKKCGLQVAPMNAFERWRMLGAWHESLECIDETLIPSASACRKAVFSSDSLGIKSLSAAEWLEKDLMRAGVVSGDAAKAALELGDLADGYRRTISDFISTNLAVGDELPRLQTSRREMISDSGTHTVALKVDGEEVRLTKISFDKLRQMYTSFHSERDTRVAELDDEFLSAVFRLILRYDSIGAAGFHASIGPNVHRVLHDLFHIRFEGFASPLNCTFTPFCSAFVDIDAPFGSIGSFATHNPQSGAIELNPPFVPGLIDAACIHALSLLNRATVTNSSLTIIIFIPGWLDSLGWRTLCVSEHLRQKLVVSRTDHGFVDGAQHCRVATFRSSPFDTGIFVLQSPAAFESHQVDRIGYELLEEALAACTPSLEDLRFVPCNERVGGGRNRKRKRWGRKRLKSVSG